MEIFDGSHAEKFVRWMFEDQPEAVLLSIIQSVMDLLEDGQGAHDFLGARVQCEPGVSIIAYATLYPGNLAVLTGPKCLTNRGVSSFDPYVAKASELCEALTLLAQQRWPIEMMQITIPSDSEFEAKALVCAGFQRLSRLYQIVLRFPCTKQIPVPKLSREKWKQFELEHWDRLRDWLDSSYEQTLDCPEMATLRCTNNVMEGYWRMGNGRSSIRAAGSDVAIPQWWLRLEDDCGTPGPVKAAFLLTPINFGVWELTYLGVGSKFRGQGLGKETLAMTLEKLKELKATQVIAYVDSRNIPAFKLYEHAGFRAGSKWDAYHRPLLK
jgi:ribosomal protein S18 acetylase RimI-like enzyme